MSTPADERHATAAKGRLPETARAWDRLAEAGDVDALWRLLADTPRGLVDHDAAFRRLLRAAEVNALRDPAGFAQHLFARMAALTGYLVLRAHFCAGRPLADAAGRIGAHAAEGGVHDGALARLAELQGHAAELLHLQAATARLNELARGKRLENDAAEASAGGRRGPGRPTPLARPRRAGPVKVRRGLKG